MSERGLTPQRLMRDRGQRAGRPVPVAQRGEAIRQGAVVQASGLRAFGNVFERLAGTAGRMFEVEARKEADKAERVSAEAGTRFGADAELADLQRLPVGDTRGEQAFRKAALVAAGSTAEVQIREIVSGLETAHAAQPEAFRRLLDAEAKGFVSKLPAEMQGPARETFTRLGIAARGRLQDQERKHQIDAMQAQLMRDTQSLVVSTAQEARRGDYQDAMASLGVLADVLAESGPVASGGSGVLTLSQIEEQVQKAQGLIRTEYMLGHLDRVGKTRANLNALKAGQTGDPIADAVMSEMMPAEKDRLVKSLEAEVNRAEAEWRARERDRMLLERDVLARRLADEEALLANGHAPAEPVTQEDFVSAFGVEEGLKRHEQASARLQQAATLGTINTMTAEEQNAMLAETLPDPASEGYADAMKLYNERVAAVGQSREAMLKDPGGFVARHDPIIADLWALAGQGDQAAYQEAVTLTLADQARRGLPQSAWQPLPKAMVDGVVAQFNEQADPRARLGAFMQLLTNDDESVNRMVAGQFEAARGNGGGLPAGTMMLIADMAETDPNMAARTLDALMVPKGDLTLPQGAATAFNQALDAAVTTGTMGVRQKQMELTGLPGYAAFVGRDRELVERLAKVEIMGGADPAEAVEKAQAQLFGHLTAYDSTGRWGDGLGALILPAGAPHEPLEAGLAARRRQVAQEIAATAARSGDAIAGRQLEDYARRIEARGVWVNSGADLVLIDNATQQPMNVSLARASLDEVLALGSAELAERRARQERLDQFSADRTIRDLLGMVPIERASRAVSEAVAKSPLVKANAATARALGAVTQATKDVSDSLVDMLEQQGLARP